MPGLILEDMEQAAAPLAKVPEYGFLVSHQTVDLDVDFSTQTLTGRTEITILPLQRDLREIRIDARQCKIAPDGVEVNGRPAKFVYEDPMKLLETSKHISMTANQWHLQKEKLSPLIQEDTRAEGALRITVPFGVEIVEVNPLSDNAANALAQRAAGTSIARASSMAVNGVGDPSPATPTLTPKTAADQSARFQPLVIVIRFTVAQFREGLHFVGLSEVDKRYPHVYTRHSVDPGVASCIFPCIDDPAMRCTWEMNISCSRTLGDALKRRPVERISKPHHHSKKGHAIALTNGINAVAAAAVEDYVVPLSDEEKLMEMTVTCSGEMIGEAIDERDSSKKTVSFICASVVAAQHVGFAIGPFEQIDLSEFREEEDEEKIGQDSLPVWGYCLPGRSDALRYTCQAMAHTVDWFVLSFGSFPFPEAKFVFVDDQVRDVEHTASLSLCSNRLLYTEDMIDPEKEVFRTLAHALAAQWIGINIVPNQPFDRWVTIGLSHYMTGLFMKTVSGNNDYQFRQKTQADKLVELDFQKPSIYDLGKDLKVGAFEYDFMVLKAPLVLFILDKRIIKSTGSAGLSRVISKMIVGANTGGATESVVSTDSFRKLVEKTTKYRQTDHFWNQWVLGAGCPKFSIVQKFNKKRLCVEMKITQKQDVPIKQDAIPPLSKRDFYREFKEDIHQVYAGAVQPLFTGPMTIRIHEADGTPYEHIVEIRDGTGSFEIPYNTKYKRLKRTRRMRERAAVSGISADVGGEPGEDTLFYCLGDVLVTPAEMKYWGLVDWDQEMQAKMEGESYEWIRIDADFEWLCTKEFLGMPGYMYMSQLQQDRDVVAQQESMLWLKSQPAHPLAATFLIRTLMDTRYFHGIRTMAAEILPTHAVPQTDWIGLKHLEKAYMKFCCYTGTSTPRPNDFRDRAAYFVAQSIPKAVAQIRGIDGRCPKEARQFILDQLRFNDNGVNTFSDNFKVASLLSSLAESLIPRKKDNDEMIFHDDDEIDEEPERFRNQVIDELDRHRRMDEWIHSYNNIYTVTALNSKHKLMKAGLIPVDPMQFAKYIHDGTADVIRIKAFEALLDLGLMTNGPVVAYLLNVATTDNSPYVRHCLYEQFCLGLATVAFGNGPKKSTEAPIVNGDDLIVEEATAINEERKDHIERTTNFDAALDALKRELKDNEPLKAALWKSVNSVKLGLFEKSDYLDVCQILYEPKDSMIFSIAMPRYWTVKREGQGVLPSKLPTLTLHFTQNGRLRKLKPKPKVLPAPSFNISESVVVHPPKTPQALPQVPPRLHLSFSGTGANSMGPPAKTNKRPHPPERISSSLSSEGPPRKMIKLNVGGPRLAAILNSPPKPARAKAAPARSSPAPKKLSASPALLNQSPAPPLTVSTSHATQPATILGASVCPVAKPRKPLPDSGARKPLPDSGARKPLPDSVPPPPTPVKKPSIILKLNKNPKTD